MSDDDVQQVDPAPKRTRKAITEKQRQARIRNLAEGRKKRMENLAKKKTKYPIKDDDESDTDGEESESDGEDVEFVVTKNRKVQKEEPKAKPHHKERKDPDSAKVREEIETLKQNFGKLAKKKKRSSRPVKEQNFYITPTAPPAKASGGDDPLSAHLEALSRSVFGARR